MHFYELIKKLTEDKKTIIYVDMDGVIASYDFGKPLDFNEVNEKNEWLNKYAPFFEKDKRTIIPKESYPHYSSKELKLNYLKSLKNDEQIIFIDDDNEVLRTVRNGLKNIMLYQDSELID